MSEFLSSTSQLVEDDDDIDHELSFDSSSEDNEEDVDETHDQLIEAVSSIGRKRQREQRDEPSTIVSEFNLSRGNVRVDTDELLSGLTNKKGLKQLKQKLNKIKENTTHLIKPLAPVQKDKIHRKIAYQKSSKQVSDWDPIVKYNRRAEHLKFPLQDEVPSLPSLTAKVESFKAVTPLEVAVQDMLSQSDCVIPDNEELSKSEKRALLKLSIQEAKERRAELSKMRSLLSAFEQKQRRIKRIKSKKFHKVQRKRREKLEAKKVNENGDDNLLEKAEKMRAQERATLKHSRMSKWAKEQLTRQHKDQSTRLALTEQSRLKSEIKQKVLQESDSDVESVTSEASAEGRPADLIDPANPWLANTGQTSNAIVAEGKDNSRTKDSSKTIDPTDFFTIEKLNEELVIGDDQNIAAVQEAFADDDVIDEFLKEKQNEIEESKPNKTDLALPGWGVWAGEGIEANNSKIKRAQPQKQEPSVPRKDDNLKYVIINHGIDKKASQHFVSKVPHPYTNSAHFAHVMATPIGRHWNTETNYNELIKPRVETKIGTVIEPMKKTDDVERFMKKAKIERANEKKKRSKKQNQ